MLREVVQEKPVDYGPPDYDVMDFGKKVGMSLIKLSKYP